MIKEGINALAEEGAGKYLVEHYSEISVILNAIPILYGLRSRR